MNLKPIYPGGPGLVEVTCLWYVERGKYRFEVFQDHDSDGPYEDEDFAVLDPNPIVSRNWTYAEHVPWGEDQWVRCCDDDLCECADLREEWEHEYNPAWKVFPVRRGGWHGDRGEYEMTEWENATAYIYVKIPWSTPTEQLVHHDHDPDAIAASIIEEWNTWLQGEVYCVCVVKEEDEEVIDSLGGIWGEEGVKEFIREHEKAKEAE